MGDIAGVDVMSSEYKYKLGIACMLVGAIILAVIAFGMIDGILPSPDKFVSPPGLGEWIVVGGFIVGIGVVIVGAIILFDYFRTLKIALLRTYEVVGYYETIIIVAVLVVTGVLTYFKVIDASVFTSVVMLILGYVTKVAVDYLRHK